MENRNLAELYIDYLVNGDDGNSGYNGKPDVTVLKVFSGTSEDIGGIFLRYDIPGETYKTHTYNGYIVMTLKDAFHLLGKESVALTIGGRIKLSKENDKYEKFLEDLLLDSLSKKLLTEPEPFYSFSSITNLYKAKAEFLKTSGKVEEDKPMFVIGFDWWNENFTDKLNNGKPYSKENVEEEFIGILNEVEDLIRKTRK